jgi:hypothetical protein
MIETKNARITSTMLGIEDHGIMSFYLYLDYGGSCQSAGGYSLDKPIKDEKGRFIKRVGTAVGCDVIMKILEVVGVEKWESLPNKNIRVRADHSKVYAIGNLLREQWIEFEEFFKLRSTAEV